jgi:hypothetical protein
MSKNSNHTRLALQSVSTQPFDGHALGRQFNELFAKQAQAMQALNQGLSSYGQVLSKHSFVTEERAA